ncbi:hypothetical protein [Natronosalvus amylolyticus]|uniref:hypothetical protein n=1 Tax=Natronosalvus amylolyticus TaxID=2961994 RepID=UPI0020C9C1CC|nr:hypothetical protein [Natronosalvus amylolyticus]
MPPRTYECPSPDDCEFVAGGAAELAAHVNTEHAGEFKREDWPDTEVARARRAGEQSADEE